MKTRARLIEAEARRLCAAGGYDPDMPGNRLLSVRESVPLWRIYARHLENDIAAVERAGFTVTPGRGDLPRPLDRWEGAVAAVFFGAAFLLFGAAIVMGWI